MMLRIYSYVQKKKVQIKKDKEMPNRTTGMHSNEGVRENRKKGRACPPICTCTCTGPLDLACVSISYAPLTSNARPIELPPQKSSYLYFLRIVAFGIKTRRVARYVEESNKERLAFHAHISSMKH